MLWYHRLKLKECQMVNRI